MSQYRWEIKGRQFVAHEHSPDFDNNLMPDWPHSRSQGAQFEVEELTKHGERRSVGAAITLMDAFQLTRMVTAR